MSRFHRYWMLSDPHLGHDKMIEMCYRPDNFSQRILNNMRVNIIPGDTFICLGDICIGQEDLWNRRLLDTMAPESKRWLIRGNHDGKSIPWYLERGWDCVVDRMDIDMFGCRIALTHRPLPPEDLSYEVNVHGHLHNTDHHPECLLSEKHRLVKCEHDYRPILLNKVLGK